MHEIYEGKEVPSHDEGMASGTSIEKSIATKQQEQSSTPSHPPSHTFIPIDQRKWNDMLAVSYVMREFPAWSVSKIVTKVSRHHGFHREDDGAIDWNSLLPKLRRDFEKEDVGSFSNSQWLDLLHRGSNKKRFQYCLDSNGNLIHLRAIQGHSGGTTVDPALLDNIEIPVGWKEYQYHVGGPLTSHSILQAELIAGGKDTEKDGRLSSPQLWTTRATRPTRSTNTCRDHERYTTTLSGK